MATTVTTPHPNTDLELGLVTPPRRSHVTGYYSEDDNASPKSAKSRPSSCSSACYLSECSVEDEVVEGSKVISHWGSKPKRDCRICHLSFDGSNSNLGSIELGCSCKGDLGGAHKHCAETWFKIRGNKTCEICGSTARNVVGVNEVELMEPYHNEAHDTTQTVAVPPPQLADTRHFWQGHKFLNFLLACMVFAFVISWLFHFNVPT